MVRTPREPAPVDRLTSSARTPPWAGYCILAVACIASVWPLLASQTIPAFQQDWTWPLSRELALQWLHAFVGLWDERSLGQANALPWQTYAVAMQVAAIMLFGPVGGLALWVALLEFGAGCACVMMLGAFNVRSQPARLIAALLYAFGPVPFTRLSAGHLAYLLGYALLPLAVRFGRAAIERPHWTASVTLGVAIGLSGCQIQFLAIGWIAVLPLAAFVPRSAGWTMRLAAAAALSLVVQLQALLPLAVSSTASLYAAQPALLNFEYNNSSPLRDAVVMLGYFTHYYEAHALPGAFGALCAVMAAALAGALWANRRAAAYGVVLVAFGVLLSSGLYGPLRAPLIWSFRQAGAFAVFRDLHYFAALTALGLTLCLGIALQRLPRVSALAALALVGWICVPSIAGSALRPILVPRAYVSDTLSVMRTVRLRGSGRVLWLPAEEPLGLRSAPNTGRDFTAYGPAGNPSVSEDYQNPQLSYALATLRTGKPDWSALSAMNVRYVVFRRYVVSNRGDTFGTGFPMAFAGLTDEQMGALLQRTHRLTPLRFSAESILYELPGYTGSSYRARTDAGGLLFSALRPGVIALQSGRQLPLHLKASDVTADPRVAWVAGTLGRRYRPWLADSIYPFVWTVSPKPLSFAAPDARCVTAAANPHGALLLARSATIAVNGTWKRYPIGDARLPIGVQGVRMPRWGRSLFGIHAKKLLPGSSLPPSMAPLLVHRPQLRHPHPRRAGSTGEALFLPTSGDLTALGDRSCDAPQPQHGRAFVVASGYDAGWRASYGGRWIAPVLANGWMMAWPDLGRPDRLLYLPAFAQLAGAIATVTIVLLSWMLARRHDARKPSARAAPTAR